MEEVQHAIVADRIGDLVREGDALRVERQLRQAHRARDGNGDGFGCSVPRRSARVRLGRWLMGIGAAVAGTAPEPRGGPASRAV
jgi:hypothetical protein